MTPGPPRTGERAEPVPPPDLSGWTIAVLGLGTMGAGMAHRLAGTGATMRVFNRTADSARRFAQQHRAAVAGTPAEAADGADLVLIAVADDDALRQVLVGPDGVADSATPPRVVVNTSTVAPETLRGPAERLPLIAAGILGNATHARQGLLRWYVGGPADLVEAGSPVAHALARQVLQLGDLGAGMRLKIALNLLMGLEMQALAEVVRWGEAAGLSRSLVLDAVSDSGFAAPVMRFKADRMATGRYEDADFRLRLMAKDLSLAITAADASATDLPMSWAAARTHSLAVAAGLGDADCAAILQALEEAAVTEVNA